MRRKIGRNHYWLLVANPEADILLKSPVLAFFFFNLSIVHLNALPWKRTEIIPSFLRLHPSIAFQTLLLTMMAIPFLLKGFLPTLVDIMVICVKLPNSS